MFKFFIQKAWMHWSLLGTLLILCSTWYQVQIDVAINEWFGVFYNNLQEALATPGSVTPAEFYGSLASFGWLAAKFIVVAVITKYFVSHWIFRWRTSMVEYYHDKFKYARGLEGASQRIQEDTIKFARIMEDLGVGLMEAVMTLIAFIPILIGLSAAVTHLPILGEVSNSLMWVAIVTALGGTLLLAAVGIRLPGIEYDIQKREAGYRKVLVHAEDDPKAGQPKTLSELFDWVRDIHFKSYFHYAYFNMARYSYFQGMVLIPYLALGPTILAGTITLGVLQQTIRAFGRVEGSLQYVVKSWAIVVELMSVYKRLTEFEKQIELNEKGG
tara:strand:+ start:275 stop:1258 length:984 start_codon:yes stop_codon:yes gene_type:complete